MERNKVNLKNTPKKENTKEPCNPPKINIEIKLLTNTEEKLISAD